MRKQGLRLPERSHITPRQSHREDGAAPDRALPLAPGAILQRAALAPQSLRPADILRLQRTLGNRAVAQWLSQFSPARSLVQAKLTVNPPGDLYEREADQMAAEVANRINSGGAPAVQRASVAENEDEEKLMMKPLTRLRGDDDGFATTPGFEAHIEQARGGGQPLADDVKAPMERAFGADFGRVRLHADAHSDQLNRSIQARAFTAGRDIFFWGALRPAHVADWNCLPTS